MKKNYIFFKLKLATWLSVIAAICQWKSPQNLCLITCNIKTTNKKSLVFIKVCLCTVCLPIICAKYLLNTYKLTIKSYGLFYHEFKYTKNFTNKRYLYRLDIRHLLSVAKCHNTRIYSLPLYLERYCARYRYECALWVNNESQCAFLRVCTHLTS